MSDDQAHDELDRDREIAEILAVAPLDDLTRRRMVRVAVDERPRAARPVGRLTAVVGVAAALVIGVLVGTVVVTRPDDPAPTTAARAPEPSSAPKETADADADVPASATRLGDLGTVVSPAALRDAITARLEAGEGRAAESADADACVARGPEAAGLVAISAVGTATLSGANPAVVLVGPTPSGGDLAVALSPSDCAVLETVALGG